MTLALLKNLGVKTKFKDQNIRVKPQQNPIIINQVVESDWSSASYFFSVVALSDQSEIYLTSYKNDSLQGDRVLRDIYSQLGVVSSIEEQTLKLKKEAIDLPRVLHCDLTNTPSYS